MGTRQRQSRVPSRRLSSMSHLSVTRRSVVWRAVVSASRHRHTRMLSQPSWEISLSMTRSRHLVNQCSSKHRASEHRLACISSLDSSSSSSTIKLKSRVLRQRQHPVAFPVASARARTVCGTNALLLRAASGAASGAIILAVSVARRRRRMEMAINTAQADTCTIRTPSMRAR